MRRSIALLLLAVVGSVLSLALKRGTTEFNRKRWLIRGRPWHGLVPKPTVPANSDQFPSQWFVQPVDNFDSSNKKEWQQQYWSNDQWYKPGGPIFLMLGGEGPEDNSWVSYAPLEWLTLAKKFNAMVYLIEHRFYGRSQPFGNDFSSKNLVYLSSEQALADMANFIKAKNKENNYSNPKWIVFGGSYSGALAAWAREKYPDLVFGALASSAPIQAEVDFYQYLEVVQYAFNDTDKQCADIIHKGFQKLVALAKSKTGRQTLRYAMNLCADLDVSKPENVNIFWEAMIGNYMGVVQYGGDNAGAYRYQITPQAVCKILKEPNQDTLTLMANVNNFFMEMNGESCLDIDYDEYINYMKNPTDNSDRAWIWQTCTEFGYYQTTDSKTAGPFFGDNTNSSMPAKWLVDECGQIYGNEYNGPSVYDAIKKTNGHYGGAGGFKSTRVIFPNGDHDPWHALGELHSVDPSSPAIVIHGTAHCADMYEAASDDLPGLTSARKKIFATFAQWLS